MHHELNDSALMTLADLPLQPEEDVPEWAMIGEFVSITHTSDELVIVLRRENHVPRGREMADREWRALNGWKARSIWR